MVGQLRRDRRLLDEYVLRQPDRLQQRIALLGGEGAESEPLQNIAGVKAQLGLVGGDRRHHAVAVSSINLAENNGLALRPPFLKLVVEGLAAARQQLRAVTRKFGRRCQPVQFLLLKVLKFAQFFAVVAHRRPSIKTSVPETLIILCTPSAGHLRCG